MHFKNLDLNLLVALDVLLTECSISRAADRLNMSQSAMSNALARLRKYFNDELLVRVGRKLERTPRAERLRDAVRDILVRVDCTISDLPEFVPAESDREFTLFVSDYTLQVLMPHVIQLARAQSTGIHFRLLAQTNEPKRALERGEADLLIIPKSYCSSDHPSETVFREDFLCTVWKGSQRWFKETMDFEDYAGAGHVVMQPGDANISFEAWFLQRYGLSRRVEVATFSFTALPHLVLGTDFVATVHARLARQAQRSLPVKLFIPPVQIPKMEQVMQWHQHRTQDPGLVWLRKLILAAAQRMDSKTPAPVVYGTN